jgi:3-(3-hydroxy-phenyl)propionate hydroxylase
MLPGAPMEDAPVMVEGQPAWLLGMVGNRFCGLLFVDAPALLDGRVRQELVALGRAALSVEVILVSPRSVPRDADFTVLHDVEGLVSRRS